jgi:hypothetical protein
MGMAVAATAARGSMAGFPDGAEPTVAVPRAPDSRSFTAMMALARSALECQAQTLT